MPIAEVAPQPEKLTLTVKEAARLVGVSEWTLRQAIRNGQIHTVKIGQLERVPRARLLQLLSSE